MEATDGLGVMRVFECTGTELGINQACHSVERRLHFYDKLTER